MTTAPGSDPQARGPADLDPGPRDDANPLAHLRDRVVRSDPDLVYLDGNSLGMLPVATRDRLRLAVEAEWGGELVRGWQHWADLPVEVGDRLGAALLGAGPGQTVVCDTISANLWKAAAAVLADVTSREPARRVVVTDAANFPSDRYVLAAAAAQAGGALRTVAPDPVHGVTPERLADALTPGDVALVSLQLVDYRSGALLDLAATTRQCHDAGALVVWELAHAAGAVPVTLDDAGADLAVGCTYKYLNAGPGAPGFLYVADRHLDVLTTPLPGWWSAADPFDMDAPYVPAERRGPVPLRIARRPGPGGGGRGRPAAGGGRDRDAAGGVGGPHVVPRGAVRRLAGPARLPAGVPARPVPPGWSRRACPPGGVSDRPRHGGARRRRRRATAGSAQARTGAAHDLLRRRAGGMRRIRDLVAAGEHLALPASRDRVT